MDVNDMDRMVGYGTDPNTWESYGILWDECGNAQNFNGPSADSTYPAGINESGHVVGCYTIGNNDYGFLRAPNGTYSPVQYPDASWTCPNGINDSGQIVGVYGDSNGAWKAFVDLSR